MENAKNIPEMFGCMVFGDSAMREHLPEEVYATLRRTIRRGAPLDIEIANPVADAMKAWAIERGATHYSHWFQPLTGITAEKHDSFIEPASDGQIIMKFSGKSLVRGESDASSFPNGGLRATFEARGYTAWDPTSPAFVRDSTLYIPTVFCSLGGDTLDKKTPLLRSVECLRNSARRLMTLFGKTDIGTINPTVGAEQEYFLIPEELFRQRLDLRLCGRTLFGARPPKAQELGDHYFGAIKPRVKAFMEELDEELWKLGIMAKTEHNEAAPCQHELAPIFCTTNTACDHNQLTMEMMKRVATKHGLVCLLHEKPFAYINGSGKHNNWSISTSHGINLMDPGDSPADNAQFLLVLTSMIAAVDEYADLLRISVAEAGNDHRLGAGEAPPAIISVFLGDELTEILDCLAEGRPYTKHDNGNLDIGASVLPKLPKDNTDRNRTSPFAFTGNRFEFRAVGSEANCACAMIALNGAVAEQLVEFKQHVDALIANGMDKREALIKEIQKLITYCKPIRFDGNGYSEEWKAEAARRGLDCVTSAPDIFKAYASDTSVQMFESLGIMNRAELEARNEIKWEIYTKKIQIEARIFGDMALNHIIPVATKYQSQLVDNVYKMKEILGTEGEALSASNINLISRIASLVHQIEGGVAEMIECRKVANRIQGQYEKAVAYHDTVAPKLEELRSYIDDLEEVADDSLWPLPKYRELLFIR